MTQIGYLKLLITRSILSGPLDFEIKRVACIQCVYIMKAKCYQIASVKVLVQVDFPVHALSEH